MWPRHESSFLSPNSELSLGYCGTPLHNPVHLRCSVLSCSVGAEVSGEKEKKSRELGARLDCRGCQCEAKEISYVYELS